MDTDPLTALLRETTIESARYVMRETTRNREVFIPDGESAESIVEFIEVHQKTLATLPTFVGRSRIVMVLEEHKRKFAVK